MKKVASIIAVMVMTLGLFSCETESATNDNPYENLNTSANDQDEIGSARDKNGSGGD